MGVIAALLTLIAPPADAWYGVDARGYKKPLEIVVKDEANWRLVWRRAFGNRRPPAVDFSKYRVLAVFAGEQQVKDQTVQVETRLVSGELEVRITHSAPVVTVRQASYPYRMVLVPIKDCKKVRFLRK